TNTSANAKSAKAWRSRIDACKTYRRQLLPDWQLNIDYRRGKPFTSDSDQDRVAVNIDWPSTKAKQAQLFSQVPQVHITPPLPGCEKRLTAALTGAGVGVARDECLPDCINAAGIGAVIVAYEARTEDVEAPAIDLSLLPPQVGAQVQATGAL